MCSAYTRPSAALGHNSLYLAIPPSTSARRSFEVPSRISEAPASPPSSAPQSSCRSSQEAHGARTARWLIESALSGDDVAESLRVCEQRRRRAADLVKGVLCSGGDTYRGEHPSSRSMREPHGTALGDLTNRSGRAVVDCGIGAQSSGLLTTRSCSSGVVTLDCGGL